MPKLACILLLPLLATSIIATQIVAKEDEYQLKQSYGEGSLKSYGIEQSVQSNAQGDAGGRSTTSPECSSAKCLCVCVPPGFYGNKGLCPCYNNWKTKRGGPKCP